MRIARVVIQNFRGVAEACVHFEGTTVLLGDNNTGKSTVLDAIDLAIGPDRLARAQPIDEHDFYGGRYLTPENESINITIEVLIAGLDERAQAKFRNNLEFWRARDHTLLGPGEVNGVRAVGVEPCVRVRFVGGYDTENDEFTAKTWFVVPQSPDGAPLSDCRSGDKREFGFLYLRALRTGNRALSMERGSLLDVILRVYEVRAQMWERLLGQLRGLDVAGDADDQFGAILTAIRDAMREIVPGEWADAPHLRVSELTREDLRRVLKSFLATGVDGHAAPFQHQGSGTINALLLAMLGLIADRREGRVIFAMEEPELCLPPHVQKRVVDRVRSLASQALFSSHSPYVIEDFSPSEMSVLSRRGGVLTAAPVELPANLRPKAFREGVRTRFCEALLARRVVVVEGKTELVCYCSAARRAALLMPDRYSRLDAQGWVVFDAGGQGNVASFAAFFRGLGKTVATIFDRQNEVGRAAIRAACDVAFEQLFDGFEDLLSGEAPPVAQARFIRQLRAQNEWPGNLVRHLPPGDAEDGAYREAFIEAIRHKKGDDFVALFISQCAIDEIPPTMLRILSALSDRPAAPIGEPPVGAEPADATADHA